MEMNNNIFEQAAQYARICLPHEKNILIVPVDKRSLNGVDIASLPRYPVLYVTDLGYIPYATKMEILRRNHPNLFLVGGKDDISEWVEYVLSTFTKGRIYRIIAAKTTAHDQSIPLPINSLLEG